MSRIAVIGGGIAGLIAAEVFRSAGNTVVLVEKNALGGDFLNGSQKCIRKTHNMIDLLNRLEIPWSDHTIRSGILLRGNVVTFPDSFEDIPVHEISRIHADYYRKTRGISISEFGQKSMNEPGTGKNDRRALRCDPSTLVKALGARANVAKVEIEKITEDAIFTTDKRAMTFDYCIITMPLWAANKLVDWYVPEAVAVAQNVLRVLPKVDPFVRWDSIYTPYTPGNAIHRINVFESCWDCEYNGPFDESYARALDDICTLFPSGFRIQRVFSNLKGHLFPLSENAQWPENVVPLGPFAKWDIKSTADSCLEESKKLAVRWGM